ncbi:MAG: hypothetical protein Q9168_000501 [Polycauliona sp. 1 TL-2023]
MDNSRSRSRYGRSSPEDEAYDSMRALLVAFEQRRRDKEADASSDDDDDEGAESPSPHRASPSPSSAIPIPAPPTPNLPTQRLLFNMSRQQHQKRIRAPDRTAGVRDLTTSPAIENTVPGRQNDSQRKTVRATRKRTQELAEGSGAGEEGAESGLLDGGAVRGRKRRRI